MVDRVQDRPRANHKDKHSKQVIFHIPATIVVALDIGPETVRARGVCEDADEEDEVAIAGDVLEAGAEDVR